MSKQPAGYSSLALPAIGMLIQAVMIIAAPDTAKRRGVSEVIKAVILRGGYIPLRTTLFHFLAPVICIGSGGTVGPEGPAAQLGGGVASKIGNLLNLSDSRRRMFTAAGAGAAIAAIFNSPLGGIFFALEIVLLNDFQTATFSALILSSVTASAISRIFLGNSSVFQFVTPKIVQYQNLYLYIILGVISGAVSIAFIRYSSVTDRLIHKRILTKMPQWVLMLIVGLIVGVSGYFYKDIFGIGYDGINHILASSLAWQTVLILLVLKFVLVPLTLNSGGFGGLFAPALFIGACMGFLYSHALYYLWGVQMNPTVVILVSMGAVLGGINSIPISAILIIFEMTKDYSFILPLMLAVVISTTLVQFFLKGSIHTQHLEEQGYRISHGRESSILRAIAAEDVMIKDVVLIPEETALPTLISQLMESPHSTFYTINKQNKLVGTITESELRPIITEYEHIREVLVARDIASPEVVTVRETDDLDYVMKLFETRNSDEFPVVAMNNPDQVIGTIRRQDVISAYNRESLKLNLADGFARELRTIDKTMTSRVAEGYSIVERKVKREFVGKTLAQLRLRNTYGVEVLMIRHAASPFETENAKSGLVHPDPNYVIQSEDTFVLFGGDDKIALTTSWE